MAGSLHESEFDKYEYEEFYENYQFTPLPDKAAVDAHLYIPRFSWALDKVKELKPKNLLDLGCMDGSFALTVAKHLDIETVGIDLTMEGTEIARIRSNERNLPAYFNQGSIESWLKHFATESISFDCITMFEVIEHVEDPRLLLDLIDDVLAPGGSVLVSTPAFESPMYGMDDEANKCHIRLYTTADEDYEAVNKHGNTRKATSITKEIGKDRIKEMNVYSELINLHYQ